MGNPSAPPRGEVRAGGSGGKQTLIGSAGGAQRDGEGGGLGGRERQRRVAREADTPTAVGERGEEGLQRVGHRPTSERIGRRGDEQRRSRPTVADGESAHVLERRDALEAACPPASRLGEQGDRYPGVGAGVVRHERKVAAGAFDDIGVLKDRVGGNHVVLGCGTAAGRRLFRSEHHSGEIPAPWQPVGPIIYRVVGSIADATLHAQINDLVPASLGRLDG